MDRIKSKEETREVERLVKLALPFFLLFLQGFVCLQMYGTEIAASLETRIESETGPVIPPARGAQHLSNGGDQEKTRMSLTMEGFRRLCRGEEVKSRRSTPLVRSR